MAQGPNKYRAANRKKARQNRRMGMVVIIVLIAILFVVALLLTRHAQTADASSVSSEPAAPSSRSTPQSSESTSSSAPEPESKVIPAATGEYDVEGLPPLFNYENEIPADYLLDLVDIGGGQQMQQGAAQAFLTMQAAAAADGIDLVPVSGYRSNQQQTNNYNNSIQTKMASGMDEASAIEATQRYYAIPGTSEHEAGLAIDVNLIEDSFDQTPAFAWLQEHCTEYGFIFRYRQETEEITHIAYEPWHYRYVGANHAAAMEAENVKTLEDYIQSFE